MSPVALIPPLLVLIAAAPSIAFAEDGAALAMDRRVRLGLGVGAVAAPCATDTEDEWGFHHCQPVLGAGLRASVTVGLGRRFGVRAGGDVGPAVGAVSRFAGGDVAAQLRVGRSVKFLANAGLRADSVEGVLPTLGVGIGISLGDSRAFLEAEADAGFQTEFIDGSNTQTAMGNFSRVAVLAGVAF